MTIDSKPLNAFPALPEMDRREVVRFAALTAATGLAGSLAASASAQQTDAPPRPEAPEIDGVEWNKAPCRFCGTGCHVMVGVKGNKVVAIAGDREADVNKGLLCVKGYHVGSILYGADRLTEPMLRKNGKLEKISWEEAVDIAARKVMDAGQGFGLYLSGQSTIPEGYIGQKLMKAGLSNNHIDANARLCMASAVTGFISTYGVDEPASCFDDLENCDVLILWGNNPAEMHPVLWSRVIDRVARGEKVKIIDIGTRRTRTTEHADMHLSMQANGDLAIANAILHILVKEGKVNEEFVSKHCSFRASHNAEGLSHPLVHDEFTARLAERGAGGLKGTAIDRKDFEELIDYYTPERCSEMSEVPVEQLRELAALFADPTLRITSLWCMGVNQHTAGTAMNNMIHNVHLISGHWGRPGDGPQSLTGQPSACGTVREVGTLAHALPGGRLVANDGHRADCEARWNVPAGRIASKPGYHTVKMFEQFSKPTSEGGDISAVWVQVTNPGQSLPNTKKLINGVKAQSDKFLIVSEVYPTATTELADLVLPAAMWVEKDGVVGNSERRTQQWFRMVDPPGQARDDAWQLIAVSRRLFELGHAGLRDKDGNWLFQQLDENGQEIEIWKWDVWKANHFDRNFFEEYRPFTVLKHKNVAPYDLLVEKRGMRWPVVETSPGEYRETRWRFVEEDDPFVGEGARFAFYHSTSGDDRAQIWFRPWEPSQETCEDEFPLMMSTGRVLEHWHTGTMTRRVPELARAMPGTYLEMNRKDAADRGISNGEMVRVVTKRGSMKLPVWLGGRAEPRRGHVFVPFFDEAQPINELTLDAIDPYSKQPDYKKSAVRVERLADPKGGTQ